MHCSHAHKCSPRPFDASNSDSFIYVNEYIVFFFQTLLRWKMNNNSDAKQIQSSQQAMSHCNEQFYPNISTILQLLLTLPAASCLYERSFSSLRRLKTWSRTSMADGCWTNGNGNWRDSSSVLKTDCLSFQKRINDGKRFHLSNLWLLSPTSIEDDNIQVWEMAI